MLDKATARVRQQICGTDKRTMTYLLYYPGAITAVLFTAVGSMGLC